MKYLFVEVDQRKLRFNDMIKIVISVGQKKAGIVKVAGGEGLGRQYIVGSNVVGITPLGSLRELRHNKARKLVLLSVQAPLWC